MTAARADLLLALVTGVVSILGYMAWVVRRIRKTLRAWEQHQAEHGELLQLAHWHDHGRVIPLLPSAPAPARPHRHRAPGGPPW
jgi:hypothetical protein